MLVLKGSTHLHKIVVLNSKGGSGKTTLAFNLAGYLAATGRKAAIIDMDRQGSSMRWLRNRPSALPEIVGVPAEVSYTDSSGNQCIVVPTDIEYIVIDAPAGLSSDCLIDYTCGAHAIFIPVMPSDLDVHAASRLISDLLIKAQVSRRNQRLCVVPNRVKERTIAYQQLCRFLDRLAISVVGKIRDSQNYVWAARNGTCIHEMPRSQVSKDREQWETIAQWLEKRLATPLNSRDYLRPVEVAQTGRQRRLPGASRIALAAAVGLIAAGLGLFVAANKASVSPSGFRFSAPDPEPVSQAAVSEAVSILPEATASEALEHRWLLNGTLNWGDSGLLIVRDRATNVSLIVKNDQDLNGWAVSEIGSDYAVLSQGEDEARLHLQYE